MIREPAVAGRFYPAHAADATREIRQHLGPQSIANTAAIGCVVPHAGWMYSGHVAGAVYARLRLPRRIIILCPRHFPAGHPLAINCAGAWRTPLGDVCVDAELAQALVQQWPLLREDAVAHRAEHSLEVQLPFLQHLLGEFTFVPVALGTDRYQAFEDLGHAVARVIQQARAAGGGEILLVASSDMNHYESDAVTRVKDEKAIARILALDAKGLYDTVRRESISMCGYGPTTAMLVAARQLGATRAELVKYATSGEVSGDHARVVGYAGIIVV
jgi:AmmeMemoRadiSam system protein B